MTISIRTLVVLSVFTGAIAWAPNDARAVQEHCETSKAGIKRCERDVAGMKSTLYTDRAHNVTNRELSFLAEAYMNWPDLMAKL